jgi:hypothetical protein
MSIIISVFIQFLYCNGYTARVILQGLYTKRVIQQGLYKKRVILYFLCIGYLGSWNFNI